MTATSPSKRALFIGIDTYPRLTQLEGCVNDVRLMRGILEETFGFPAENVTLLSNEEATRDAILRAFDAFVDSVGRDDMVVIHYAGHGSQMTDLEGDEPSGRDSTIMPFDSEGWQGDNRDITDDEINLRLERLGEKTSFTTLIFDCCHSGTISRDDFGALARYQPPDLRPPDELRRHRPANVSVPVHRGARDSGPSGWMPLADKYVLIAGCRDEEVSYEYRPPEADGKIAHGALTYFLSQELRRAQPGTTYRDVFERAAANVNGANGRQHPQMEGRADREVFGVRDITPMRFVRVSARDGSTVTIAAGAALGMTRGSVFTVYPQGTKDPASAVALGEIEITDVRSTESDARIVSETGAGAILVASYAVEKAHAWGDLRLAVQIEAAGPEADALRTAIGASPLLVPADEGTAAVGARAYLIAPRSAAAAGDPVPQLGALAEPVWAVVKPDGQLMMPPKRPDEVAVVVNNLEIMVRYRTALALDNPDPESGMRGRFDLRLLRMTGDGGWVVAQPDSASGQIIYEHGDRIAFEVASRYDEDVYVYLLDFGLSGKVKQIYPAPGAHEKLGPGITFDRGKKGGRVTIPTEFPFDAGEDGPSEGIETFKLVVSRQPVDIGFLQQAEGVRSSAPPPAPPPPSPLGVLWQTAIKGAATRDFSNTEIGEDDWTTVVRPFTLRRRSGKTVKSEGPALTTGGVAISAAGVDANVQVHGWGSDLAAAAELRGGTLSEAFVDAGIEIRKTVEISDTQPARSGTRSGAPPSFELTLNDPGPGNAQMVMVTDELGTISWHFAQPPSSAPGTRGGDAGARTYHITGMTSGAPAGAPTKRGLVGIVGRKFVKELVFPLIDPVIGALTNTFTARWEEKHRPYRVRTFTPDDFGQESAGRIDGEGWRGLSGGRSLLVIHGTFSRAHTAFGAMPRDFVESLHALYGGRVWAIDHPTLSHDPKQNVNWLIDQLPADANLDFDVICHSRGGLVSRMLSEKQGEFSAGSRTLRVGKVVFVGSPNAGTILADSRHVGDLIDTYTNLLNFLPDNGVSDILSAVVTVAKQIAVGAAGGLPGLASMQPDGKFAKWMNDGPRAGETRYFALSSDYTPSEPGLAALAKNRLMDGIFKAPNDLVVPTNGVFEENGSGFFPIDERVVYSGSDSVAHTAYFAKRAAREKIMEWLNA